MHRFFIGGRSFQLPGDGGRAIDLLGARVPRGPGQRANLRRMSVVRGEEFLGPHVRIFADIKEYVHGQMVLSRVMRKFNSVTYEVG